MLQLPEVRSGRLEHDPVAGGVGGHGVLGGRMVDRVRQQGDLAGLRPVAQGLLAAMYVVAAPSSRPAVMASSISGLR
jgi:hypothetical protein